ncbi:MAG: protein-disulfide reductase DsbD family protein [Fimbriimonas sp.]
MTARIPRFLLVLWLSLVAVLATAQPLQPIKFSGSLEPGKVAPNQDATVILRATIEPKWHLYSLKTVPDGPQPTTISIPAGQPFVLAGEVEQQEPEVKLDPNFGKEVELYSDTAEFRVPVRISKDAKGLTKAIVKVRFQGCDDRRCLPPKTIEVPIEFTVEGAAVVNNKALPTAGTADPVRANSGSQKSGILAFIGLAISAGFLALLTPCVFPMIPITVSVFSKQKKEAGWKAGIGQALAFCAGIIGTFTVVGIVLAVAFGASGVQRLATSPWVNMVLALVFVVLALSLFGAFEIGLPPSWAAKLNSKRGAAGFAGPILMGLVFSLTSFTCTMPFVGTLLVSAASGNILDPIIGMLAFSTTFALPFFLLALFPQALSRMPKSGGWLATVKAFLGFIELAAAVKFLSNVDLVWQLNMISRPTFLAIWAAIIAVAGFYLIGALRLPHDHDTSKPGPIRWGFGLASIACSIWFLSAIDGKAIGELDAFLPPDKADSRWLSSYDKALAQAKETGKPVLIDFTGVSCTNCRLMEKNVFVKPIVDTKFNEFILAKLYTDRDTPEDAANQKLQEKLAGTVTLPLYVVVSPDGTPLKIFEGAERNEVKYVEFLQSGIDAMRAKAVATNP